MNLRPPIGQTGPAVPLHAGTHEGRPGWWRGRGGGRRRGRHPVPTSFDPFCIFLGCARAAGATAGGEAPREEEAKGTLTDEQPREVGRNPPPDPRRPMPRGGEPKRKEAAAGSRRGRERAAGRRDEERGSRLREG